MATKKKKIVDEVEETIEAPEKEILQSEEISEPEKIEDTRFDFTYEVKVDATVEKAADKKTEKPVKKVEKVIKAAPVKEEELYTVKRIEGNNIFAINKKGKYIMLRKQGQYANIKFGDTISQ